MKAIHLSSDNDYPQYYPDLVTRRVATRSVLFQTVLIQSRVSVSFAYRYASCPLDETHLVVVRRLTHQEVSPKCVNESSTERRSYNRQVNRSSQL